MQDAACRQWRPVCTAAPSLLMLIVLRDSCAPSCKTAPGHAAPSLPSPRRVVLPAATAAASNAPPSHPPSERQASDLQITHLTDMCRNHGEGSRNVQDEDGCKALDLAESAAVKALLTPT